jgi:hypothetical protein
MLVQSLGRKQLGPWLVSGGSEVDIWNLLTMRPVQTSGESRHHLQRSTLSLHHLMISSTFMRGQSDLPFGPVRLRMMGTTSSGLIFP